MTQLFLQLIARKNGIQYGAYWGSDNEYEFIEDIIQSAKYVQLNNNFKLSNYK